MNYLRLSSFWKEEYPKGEVVGRISCLYTTCLVQYFTYFPYLPPRPAGTPPPGRRGAWIADRLYFTFIVTFASFSPSEVAFTLMLPALPSFCTTSRHLP